MIDFENMLVKTILVDFDGVIHSYDEGWKNGEIYGELMPRAKESILRLQKMGYEVKVFTSRDNLDEVKKWLEDRGLNLEVTKVKGPCIAIIDDRAIRFTNWKDILNYFV